MRLLSWTAQYLAALRALLVFTVVVGIAYPLVLVGVAELPGLRGQANGSLVDGAGGQPAGSRLIGQSFTDADGNPLPTYFQSRPSAAAGGLRPHRDQRQQPRPGRCRGQRRAHQPAHPGVPAQQGSRRAGGGGRAAAVLHPRRGRRGAARLSQLWPDRAGQPGGVGEPALSGHPVPGHLPRGGRGVCRGWCGLLRRGAHPGRGDAPAHPAVPADAVTASAPGLDPHISLDYARLQAARVARARGADPAAIGRLIDEHTTGRALGFLGEPAVNVLELNLALDRAFPARS